MERLWVMRHAETEWNAARLLQGHADAPLTPLGEREAHGAAELLAGEGIERIVSSDLGRAMRTAALVAERLGLEVRLDRRWREMDTGRLTGRRVEDVPATPGYEGRPDWRFPGGESLLDLRARVLAALADVLSGHEPTLVVTHAGAVRVLLGEAGRVPPERLLEVEVPRAFIGRFEVRDGRIGEATLLRA